MGQIAIYLEDELQKKVDKLSKHEGKSRSAWVKEAIEQKMSAGLPTSWFEIWGTWQDDRSPKKILQEIDAGYLEVERTPLK
ncbi:MAG: CopG family transcriptional regulator [Deltaproteobacteria bacterium]|nr:CopG family transcriptional regulator [Deltaproteobacteria bacterium]